MKKVVFYVTREESDVYKYPDDVTEEELEHDAFEWLCDNVAAWFDIIDEDEE